MTIVRFRRGRKWGIILVWALVAGLGYGGISVCAAADGHMAGGYTYCCRYWCGYDSCGQPSIHSLSEVPDAPAEFMSCGREASCLDIPCLMVDRGRASSAAHALAAPVWEASAIDTNPGAYVLAEVQTRGLLLLRYSGSDPTSESIRSTILII